MELASVIALLPVALSAAQQIATVIQQMQAAGAATTTAEQTALLQQSFTALQTANAAFNAEFANALPTT